MTDRQELHEQDRLDFLTKIIEGRFCHKCKTFSESTCNLCRKCGEEL